MKDIYLYITQRIHPGSIVVAVAFDLIWSAFEGGATASIVGIILLPILIGTIFIASFGAVTLIQRFGSDDEWGLALSKGIVLGVLAAIPFSVIGTVGALGYGAMRLMYGVDEEVILLGKLTRSWREVEKILRRLAPPEIRNDSIEVVINHLYNQRLLSNTLKDQLHTLRKQRNVNTHEISTDELAKLVDDVQAIESTLHIRFLRQ